MRRTVSGFGEGAVELSMSALPPKADICSARGYVRIQESLPTCQPISSSHNQDFAAYEVPFSCFLAKTPDYEPSVLPITKNTDRHDSDLGFKPKEIMPCLFASAWKYSVWCRMSPRPSSITKRINILGTYNRNPYAAEKRAALDLWGPRIGYCQ